jgi:hypothetical protein
MSVLDNGQDAKMAHMNQEKKSKIAAALKDIIPKDWKYSLRVDNHSAIILAIRSAPIDLFAILNSDRDYSKNKYAQLNHQYIDKVFNDAAVTAIMVKARDALNLDNFDHSDSMTDYYHVGHYINMHLGTWDKPFTVKVK